MQNQSQRQIKSKALLHLKSDISKDLIVDYVIDHLIDTDVFTEEEKTVILASGQSIGKVEDLAVRDQVLRIQSDTFIDLLREKMETKDFAYNSFIFIMMKEGYYTWLGNKILNQVMRMNQEAEMVAQLSAPSSQVEESVVICHDLPNKVKNLLKRDDKLDEIRQDLVRFGERGTGWLIIYGMGGSGKSILATESVRDWNCDHFADGIWWTNCGQMAKDGKFDESMLLIKMQLLWERVTENSDMGPENVKFECIDNAVLKLKSYFKKKPKSLIILDDVWNKEVLENFEIGVPVMLTTRDRGIVPYRIENCNLSHVQTTDTTEYGLSPEESRELLALWVSCAPNDLNEENVSKIIEKFKGNPLCLTLIGSFMEDYGNDSKTWKSLYDLVSRDHTSDQRSPRRRSSSGANTNFLYNSFGFDTLVQHSYEALSEDLRTNYRYFALFLEDIRIPIEVFQTIWGLSKLEVERIMKKLVEKSLVMTLKANQITLYMVHDIILNFLKTQCKHELETLHGELLDSYFERCGQPDGHYKYSSLPNDGYIYYFLGYHIYKSNRLGLFPKIFLDLSFVVNKIRYTGPSDLLNDYYNYKENFRNTEQYFKRYRDFQTFVATNADLLCDLTIDVLQLALCQPNDSEVYINALDLVSNSPDRLYLKWCNQSNVKTSKLLSTKLHSGSVRCAAFDPKGTVIMSVGSDRIIRLWDSTTGKQLRTLKGHQNTINCCQISSDGTLLISASDDGTVKIWDINYQDYNGNDNPDVFSPRPRSGSEYPHIFNGSLLVDESSHTYEGHRQSSSGDSQTEVKCCAISASNANEYWIASGGTDLQVHIWRTSDMKQLHILNAHTYPVVSCQFSQDSKKLISASGEEVIVWNVTNGQTIKRLKHEKCVQNCTFGPKLDYIFTSSGRYVYQWSSVVSKEQYINRFNNLKAKYYVRHCAVSPDGKYLAGSTTTDQILIWSLTSFAKVALATFKCADQIHWIGFNKESTKLLSCLDDGTVVIWDTSKTFGASMVALRKKFSVQNHRSDLKVLTPDENGMLRLFEGIEGKENRTLSLRPKLDDSASYDITCCALSKHCDILFGTADGELILHQNSVNYTHQLESHKREVTFCAFIETLYKFVSASRDSTFRIYRRLSRSYEYPKYADRSDGRVMLRDITDFGPIVDCKLFSRDNKCMVWSENGSLYLLDLRHNLLLDSCAQNSQINSADITSDEELIATVSGDKSVKLWRWTSGETDASKGLYEIRTLPSQSCPRSCQFAPDAAFLVIGYDNGVIKIWNFKGTEGKQHVHHFQEQHTDWVNDLAVSPNGNLIISVSKSIKLWNRSGELLQTFKTNGGSMSSIYTNFVDSSDTSRSSDPNQFNKIVTVDDAGLLYILQILNFQ